MDFWQAREGCGCVTPQDVKSIGMDVLRLRVTSPYEAAIKGSARGWSAQSGWCLRRDVALRLDRSGADLPAEE